MRDITTPGSTTDVTQGGIAGHPALDQYRNVNYARWVRHLKDLPKIAREHGMPAAIMSAQTSLLADLEMLQVGPPVSAEEAQDRDLIEVMLADPAFAEVLALEGPEFDRLRSQLAAGVARHFLRSSVWTIHERSAETLPTNP
ncbi:MAG: hypothetical protein WBG19_00285 [Thermoplasmata archaeon]